MSGLVQQSDVRVETAKPFRVTARGGAGMSWKVASGPRYVAPTPGVRLDRDRADDPLGRLEAHALVLPTGGFFANASAALIWGMPIPYRLVNGPVVAAVPEKSAHVRRARTRGRRLDVDSSELTTLEGLPVTSAARTFVDLARDLAMPDLVAVGDDVLRRTLADEDEITRVIRRRLRFTGKVRARDCLPLLNALAESPQESRARAHCILAGLGTPTVQYEVFDDGGDFVARLDLAYEEDLIAIEYDGEYHADQERRNRDASRRTRLRSLGWFIVELTAVDLRHPSLMLNKITSAMRVQRSAVFGWKNRRPLHTHR
jgi:hypothetical protein